jgi:hypothetical protein
MYLEFGMRTSTIANLGPIPKDEYEDDDAHAETASSGSDNHFK